VGVRGYRNMRVSLLVLGLVLVCLAGAQESRQEGRKRLRELVLKARAGDAEARSALAARRRKVVNRARNVVTKATPAEPQVQATPATRPRFSSRRRGGRARQPTTTEAPFIEVTTEQPAPETAAPFIEEIIPTTEALIETQPQEVVEELTQVIPSLFQPAQFGKGGVGVQATQPKVVARTKPAVQQTNQRTVARTQQVQHRPTSRARTPHRTLHSGLETGSRNELNQIDDTVQAQRAPPVQTTRRYSYFDEAGNYIFGYEAEDGSFKEEIRGLNCIVHGKYGYVDPSGIRREFNYVSGNECDPNDPEGLNQEEPMPLNDQFLHQTQSEALSEAELKELNFNRRRQQAPRRPQPQREAAPRAQKPAPRRPTPVREPTPVRQIPQVQPVQQFNEVQQTQVSRNEERFPTPNFISQPQKPRKPVSRGPIKKAQEQKKPQLLKPQPVEKQPQQPRPTPPPAPQRAIPSMFQPAQFGAGGRGVPPPPQSFNFEQEFKDVFTQFDNRGAPRIAPATRPPPPPRPATPRPTTARPAAPPTTQPPPPPPPQVSQTHQSSVPSLFQPAQFAQNKPAPPPPAPVTAAPAPAPAQSSDHKQLVFDASTGTFRHVNVQNNGRFVAAPRQEPQGRPLDFNQLRSKSPLPAIPTTDLDFENFFSNFRG